MTTTSRPSSSLTPPEAGPESEVRLEPDQVRKAFPFLLAIDSQGVIAQVGTSLAKAANIRPGEAFARHFDVERPRIGPTFDDLATCVGGHIILRHRGRDLLLAGLVMRSDDLLLMLVTPRITCIEQLHELGLTLDDFSADDLIAEFLMLVRTKDMALAESEDLSRTLFEQRTQLHETNDRLALEVAERELVEQALSERENAYRSMVNSLQEVVFQTDADGRLQFLNPVWSEITGHAVQESLGTSLLDYVHDDDRSTAAEAFALLRAGDQPGTRLEVRVAPKEGGIRWIDLHARLLVAISGSTHGIAGTLTDVTDRHEHEARLVDAHGAMLRASRLKDEFLSNMSHELRTPLNNILGLVESLNEHIYGDLHERQHGALALVESSGRHLLELINDILDLSKVEAGKLTLDLGPTPVVQVCNTALAMVRTAAMQKQLRLSHEVDPRVTLINADQRRLKQILVNLLSNAVKFTPQGGSVRLEVTGDDRLRTIDFAVIDTGIGICAEDQARLFTPFTQVDSSLSRQFNGSGLGLVLVKRMAELHEGGLVRLESTPGVGSRFTVTLAWHTTAQASGDAPPPPRPRILVADDTPINLEVMTTYLTSKGYDVITAVDGRDALRRVAADHPDLVVMDVQMPDIDGLEAMRQLRAQPETRRLPIFAATALAMSGDLERCLDAGADEYFSKPIRLKELADTMASYLKSHSSRTPS